MKEVRELQVLQIRLLPVGAIQLDQLAAPTVREALKESFKFIGSGPDYLIPGLPLGATIPMLQFKDGEFMDNHGQRVVVSTLSLESRRILSRVAGTSQQADQFIYEFTSLVKKLVPSMETSITEVIYKAEETTCVVNLDFEFSKLFRPKVASFLRKTVATAASEPGVKASAEPIRFSARIEYDITERHIKEHGIKLNPKEFVIEPRAGVPLSDRTYLTKSPLPSDLHIQIVRDFELSVS